MTQEDKTLLLKDLCMRLPYGVRFNYGGYSGCDYTLVAMTSATANEFPIEDCKPYLRPMKSMTEEEKEEYHSIQSDIWKPCGTQYYDNWHSIDWLNKNMFDYCGLIPKGLAIEINESNNPYND